MRKAGLLMPVASLPSAYGVGDFGSTSYTFIDKIKKANFKLWQILPLNPLGYGNSPYQPYSSKAMDELYISLDTLKAEGLIKKLKPFRASATKIDYDEVRNYKQKYLKEAFETFKPNAAFKTFSKEKWAYNYAVFLTLKKANEMKCWNEWPNAHKQWILDHKLDLSPFTTQIQYELFIQFTLLKQWFALRKYANSRGIEIMGDIPIYVGIDSDDVWTYQEGFLLDQDGRPTFIAGVPPDYFSAEGQRWGNPLYDWDKLKKDGFKFWLERLAYSAELFDVVRIDHFRAFDTYWKIPASCPTAIEGEWVEAPGYDLFDKIYSVYPDIKIVAEDLGDLRPEVLVLRDHYHMVGMRIVQHSFDPDLTHEMMDREHLIAYTGTHDNETVKFWFSNLSPEAKKQTKAFFKYHHYDYKSMVDNLIQYTLDTKANLAILPMTDLLNKDDRSRLNFPGTVGNPNWQWKLKDFAEFDAKTAFIKAMIKRSKR